MAISAFVTIFAIVETAIVGNEPFAVSPLSMTASVPSNIAFATSVISARVGSGLLVMLSSIWVAVICRYKADNTLHNSTV